MNETTSSHLQMIVVALVVVVLGVGVGEGVTVQNGASTQLEVGVCPNATSLRNLDLNGVRGVYSC